MTCSGLMFTGFRVRKVKLKLLAVWSDGYLCSRLPGYVPVVGLGNARFLGYVPVVGVGNAR